MASPRDGSPYRLSNAEGSVLKSNTQTTKIDCAYTHTHICTYMYLYVTILIKIKGYQLDSCWGNMECTIGWQVKGKLMCLYFN